jgi:hypothetical protein
MLFSRHMSPCVCYPTNPPVLFRATKEIAMLMKCFPFTSPTRTLLSHRRSRRPIVHHALRREQAVWLLQGLDRLALPRHGQRSRHRHWDGRWRT